MKKTRYALAGTLTALPFAGYAADLPVKAPPASAPVPYAPLWTGWYAGVNLGAISERSSASTFAPHSGTFNYCLAFNCAVDPSQTATGVLGGVQIGYNFQSGNIVYGLETDFDLSSAKKNSTTSTTTFGATYTWSANTGIEAFGTLRPRLGYAFDRALLYVTGGLAYGKVRDAYQGMPTYTWSSGGEWRAGYTVGGGLEYQFAPNWSMRAEGLYYDLGSADHVSLSTGPGNLVGVGVHDHMTGAVGRVGLNYLFH